MNLKEFRKLVVETSGRYDLWNDDGSDNGADRLIRLGQKYLETRVHWDKMEATLQETLIGASNLMLPNARTVKSVFFKLPTMEKFVELHRITLHQARKYVLGEVYAEDCPIHYVLYRQRGVVEEVVSDNFFSAVLNMQDVLTDQNYDSLGVLIVPPLQAGQTAEIEVTGLFRQPALENDEDENYWTVEWDNLLLFATLREMEILSRNTQGRKDWEGAIATILLEQEMDFVLDESGQIDRMLG